MISPAWKHRQRVQEKRAAAEAEKSLKAQEQETIDKMASKNGEFTLLLQSIENDCKRISELPKGTARTDLKKEILPTYTSVCDAYIAGEEEYENRALTQVMIWLFDVGDIDKALEYAAVAIKQIQPLPERFTRDVKTYVADAFLEWVALQIDEDGSVEPYFTSMLNDVIEWAVHDDIKLKYVRQAAKLANAAGELDTALEYCNKAEEIDASKAKVKTLKKELVKAIAARDEAAAAEAAKPQEGTDTEKSGTGEDNTETEAKK